MAVIVVEILDADEIEPRVLADDIEGYLKHYYGVDVKAHVGIEQKP